MEGIDVTYENFGTPIKCGSLRVNRHVIISGRPCKILSISTAKTGKHGHAKSNIEGIDIFTEKKYFTSSPTTHNLYEPTIVKTDYQVQNVEYDDRDRTGMIEIFDGKNNKYLSLPNQCESDLELADKIVNEFRKNVESADADIYVFTLAAIGEEHIKGMRIDKF